MPGINFLTDVEGFLTTWGRPVSSGTRAGRRPARQAKSTAAPIFSCSHPAFRSSLEPGVRDVVLALIESFGCVTYSSCEGHRATARAPIRRFHVGMLARSPNDHIKLSRALRGLARKVNRKIGPGAPLLHIEGAHLDSESGSWPCLDLFFVSNGLPDETYFSRLPYARRALLDLLSTHGREPGLNKPGRGTHASNRRIVTALTTPSISALRKRFRSAAPYPHLYFSGLLTRSEAMAVCSAIPERAWNRVERPQYQFEAVDLLASASRRRPLRALVEGLGSEQVRNALSTITGRPRLALDALHVHRMSRGQSVSVHTDSEGHSSAARLVVYLDDRRTDQGGVHLLLRERSRDYVVENHVVPRAGSALLFPMNRRSFHAVTRLATNRPRLTLVATYVSSKAP